MNKGPLISAKANNERGQGPKSVKFLPASEYAPLKVTAIVIELSYDI